MKVFFSAVSLLAILLAPGLAQTQNRYVERPPALVSPDLAAPWVMQLRRPPHHANPDRRDVRRAAPVRQSQQRRRVVRQVPRPHHTEHTRIERRPIFQRREQQPLQTRRQPRAQTAAIAPRAPSAPEHQLDPRFLPQTVEYSGPHAPGTIVVDTQNRFLYHVMEGGKARRYGVGVGKPGFEWAGTHRVSQKREWPDWRPPQSMIERERKKGKILPAHVEGGPHNPLGARALYLGSTLYRIHGTNAPWTIGKAVSSGCIRMRNKDVLDLYERVPVGAKVVVI